MAINTREFINSIFKFLGKDGVEVTGEYSEKQQANDYSLSNDLHVKFFNNIEGQLESVLITKTKQDGSRTASLFIDYEQKVVRFTLDEEEAVFVYKVPEKPYYNLEMSIKPDSNSNGIMVVGYEKTDSITIAPCKENHRAQYYKVRRGEMLTSSRYTRSEALKYILNDFTSTRTAKILYKLLERLGIEEVNRIDFLELLLNNKHGLSSIINSEYWAILSENYYEALIENEQGVGKIDENHPSYTESDIEDIEAKRAVQLLGNIAKYLGINPSNLVWKLGIDRRTNLPTYSINYNGLYIFAILTDNMDIYEIEISRYDQGSTSNDPDYSISVNFRFGAAQLVIKNKSHSELAKYSMLRDYSVTPSAIIGPVVKMNKEDKSSASGTQSFKLYRVGKQGPSGRLGMVDARERSVGYLLRKTNYHSVESSSHLKPREAREKFFNKITDQDTVKNLYITLLGLGIPNENIIPFVRGIYGLFAEPKRFNALFGGPNGITNFEEALGNIVRSNMPGESNPEVSSFLVDFADYLPIDKQAKWICRAEKHDNHAMYTTRSNGLEISVELSNATAKLSSITIKRISDEDSKKHAPMISLKASQGQVYLCITNATEKYVDTISYQIFNHENLLMDEEFNVSDSALRDFPDSFRTELPRKIAYKVLEQSIISVNTLKSLYEVLISLGIPNEKILDFVQGIYVCFEEQETLDRLFGGNAEETFWNGLRDIVSVTNIHNSHLLGQVTNRIN